MGMVGLKHLTIMILAQVAIFGLICPIQAVIFQPQNDFQALSGKAPSVPVDLHAWFNNRAFGLKPNDSSFDGSGSKHSLLHIEQYD